MKALTCPVILSGASTRADGSVSLRLVTPELQPDEKTAFFELQGINCKLLLQPADNSQTEFKEVKGELSEKTPSQRLRNVLFLLWKQQDDQSDFDTFYRIKMNGIIEHLKAKITT